MHERLKFAYHYNMTAFKNSTELTEDFCKKFALINFVKFTDKHLQQSLDFTKVINLVFELYLYKISIIDIFR